MAFFNSKIKRFLMAIAGKDTCPDPDSPYERCLADIAKRIDEIEQKQEAAKPLVVTFSGTTDGGDAACDKTWEEIQAAGKNLDAWYKNGDTYYHLSTCIYTTSLICTYIFISDISDPSNSYTYIACNLVNTGTVFCTYEDV